MIELKHQQLTAEQLLRAKTYGKKAAWQFMTGPCIQDPIGIFKYHVHSWLRFGSHVYQLYINLSPQAPQ